MKPAHALVVAVAFALGCFAVSVPHGPSRPYVDREALAWSKRLAEDCVALGGRVLATSPLCVVEVQKP